MNRNSLRELLYDAVPTPPLELRTPPLDAIRRRAGRRRQGIGIGTAAALLVVAAVGAQVLRTNHPVDPSLPGATSTPSSVDSRWWTFAVVSRDERSVVVVGEGPGATKSCPDAFPVEPMQSRAPVHVVGDQVVLPVPEATLPGCAYRVAIQLDGPLGTRDLVDAFSHTALTTLRERSLPIPTYPNGITADSANTNVVDNAPRPTWFVLYNLPDGYTISVNAVPANLAPSWQVQEQLSANGRNMQILKPPMGGEGIVVWIEEGWQISVTVDPAEHRPLGREELQRVIDGLYWP
jgi:hypothetical protein